MPPGGASYTRISQGEGEDGHGMEIGSDEDKASDDDSTGVVVLEDISTMEDEGAARQPYCLLLTTVILLLAVVTVTASIQSLELTMYGQAISLDKPKLELNKSLSGAVMLNVDSMLGRSTKNVDSSKRRDPRRGEASETDKSPSGGVPQQETHEGPSTIGRTRGHEAKHGFPSRKLMRTGEAHGRSEPHTHTIHKQMDDFRVKLAKERQMATGELGKEQSMTSGKPGPSPRPTPSQRPIRPDYRPLTAFEKVLVAGSGQAFNETSPDRAYEVLASDPGEFDGCSGPMLWMVMGGHLRTLDKHVANTRAFLQRSSRCYFLLLFLRPFITEGSTGYFHKFKSHTPEAAMWRSVDILPMASSIIHDGIGSNAAFVITSAYRRRGWANVDTYKFSRQVVGALREFHGITSHPQDIVVLTRPDIVFAQAIDTDALFRVTTPFNLNLPHSSTKIGTGNDPSEILVISSMNIWEERPGYEGCAADLLSFYLTTCGGVAGYVRKELDVYAHRLGKKPGEFSDQSTTFNNPCPNFKAKLNEKNQTFLCHDVKGVIDLTAMVTPAYSHKGPQMPNTNKKKGLGYQYISSKKQSLFDIAPGRPPSPSPSPRSSPSSTSSPLPSSSSSIT